MAYIGNKGGCSHVGRCLSIFRVQGDTELTPYQDVLRAGKNTFEFVFDEPFDEYTN